MCTLIALHRCVPGSPLVIAANRDEFLARPAEGPAIRAREKGPILAPLDKEAGGTWLGLNAQGVFVGLTNLRPSVDPIVMDAASMDPGRATERVFAAAATPGVPGARSRGEVVLGALDGRTARESAEWIAGLGAESYNPFQLLVADDRDAFLTVYRDKPTTRRLAPGVHVVGNVEQERIESLAPLSSSSSSSRTARDRTIASASEGESHEGMDSEEPRARKLVRIEAQAEELLAESVTGSDADLLTGLGGICQQHVESNPFESTCVHVENRYGTRSSLLLELAQEPGASRLWASDGPPCERPYEDLTGLLNQLEVASN